MRADTRKIVAIGIVVAVLGALLVAAASGAKAAKKPAGPVIVFEDVEGDAGNQNQGAPGASELGLDLVSGTIQKDGDNLVFTVTHAAMPPTGTLPELGRFLWHFNVDGEEWRVHVKSFDIGKPDVLAGSGQERVGQVYTSGIYRLEQCTEDTTLPITLVNCNPAAYLEGAFDVGSMAFTFNVPLEAIKAKPKSVIQGGTTGAASTNCMICWVPHILERSLTPSSMIDSAIMTVPFTVPKK